jgi:DNA-binding LacI/PurR family transcriptional regulator
MGIIRGLNDAGRSVPEEVSVVGFDDHPIAKVWNPALTTIRQQFVQAGRRSFEILEENIKEASDGKGHAENWNRLVSLPGKLVVRESAAAVE